MFFIDVNKELILEGAVNEYLSPAKKAIEKCERINWFLYRADYVTGEKDWAQATPKVKAEIFDGIVKYVLCLEGKNRERSIMSINFTPYMRRVRNLI